MTIGPFSLPPGVLVAASAVLALLAVGNAVAGANRARVEWMLWLVLGMALVAARVVFVLRYHALYAVAPLAALDLRDGGFDPAAGVLAGIVLATWLAWRNRAQRKALLGGAMAGALACVGGLALLASLQQRPPLPRLELPDLDGRPVALAALAGRPLVINLWASWCPPCRREMPVLAAAQRAYPGVRFVFVNQAEPAEKVRAYLRAHGLALDQVLLDSGCSLAQAAEAPGLPTTLFFDAHGRLAERRMGELSAATLAQYLAVLGEAPPSARSQLTTDSGRTD
jgi:thiol-disulfide isomerase/thioredoxin